MVCKTSKVVPDNCFGDGAEMTAALVVAGIGVLMMAVGLILRRFERLERRVFELEGRCR